MLGIFIFYLLIFVVVIIIVGLDNAKRTLQEIVVLPALNPEVRYIQLLISFCFYYVFISFS